MIKHELILNASSLKLKENTNQTNVKLRKRIKC